MDSTRGGVALCVAWCVLCLLCVSAFPADPEGVTVALRTDRPEAVYKVNEPAAFTIAVTDAGKPVVEGEVSVVLTFDQGKVIEQKTVKLAPEPVTVTGTLSEPGFLHCQATFSKDGKRVKATAAAAFDPTRIQPTCKMPDDFDAFWKASREEAAKIPLDLKLTPMPEHSDASQDTFYLSFANVGGTRMYGFLCVPKGKKGPFPALVMPPSAGLVKPTKPSDVRRAQRGVLYLEMCIHDFDPLNPPPGIDKRQGYPLIGAPDRNQYYFRRAILGLDRSIDYLASRPDFDGKHLLIVSGSQGGALALMLGALNPHVTAIALTKPAMCDHQAPLSGRGTPWPGLLRPQQQRTDEWVRMSEYFDAVNFARRINIPVLANVGFIDSTCPPSTGYSAFNVIPSTNKAIINLITQEHLWTVNDEAHAWWNYENKWENAQLGLGPPVGPPGKDK